MRRVTGTHFSKDLRKINLRSRIPLLFLALHLSFTASGQELIPLNTWRLHPSYQNTVDLAYSASGIWTAAQQGLFLYNFNDGSLETINALDGLHPSLITAIGFNQTTRQLYVGHNSGIVDILSDEILTISLLAQDPRSNKAVNDFYFYGNRVYISTEIGILLFNEEQQSFNATYDQLGATGEDISINELLVFDNQIYAATAEGIIKGSLDNINLEDFNQWERFSTLPTEEAVAICQWNESIVAGFNNGEVYSYNGSWSQINIHVNAEIQDLSSAGNELLIATSDTLYTVSASEQIVNRQSFESITAVLVLEEQIYIAGRGLKRLLGGNEETILPSGPTLEVGKVEVANNTIYALSGNNADGNGYSSFISGNWSNFTAENVAEISRFRQSYDVANFNGSSYISSLVDGLLVEDARGNLSLIDASTPGSPFLASFGNTRLAGLEATAEGLWLLNYGTTLPLHFFDGQQYDSYPLNNSFLLDVVVSPTGIVALRGDPLQSSGIILFNPETLEQVLINDSDLSGDLPSAQVYDLLFDGNGRLWICTERGVAYIDDVDSQFDEIGDVINPIFEGRPIFRNTAVYSMVIDGGGRKWFGTEEGLWLFDDDLTEILHRFTTDNSPIPDNEIIDLMLLQSTGELFITTTAGLISYRTVASTPQRPQPKVKIFPNPIPQGFNGTIGISGVAPNAFVKITDVNGNLVYETRANGSTAGWDLTDIRGRRAQTGVYLVFTALPDGSETQVGKFVVVK